MKTGTKIAIGASALAALGIGYYLVTSYAKNRESTVKAGLFSGLTGLFSAGKDAWGRWFPDDETSTSTGGEF